MCAKWPIPSHLSGRLFGTTASWVGTVLADIVKSEAAEKTLKTVTEATTKAVIASFVN